jgi:nicotinamidase-related amidase
MTNVDHGQPALLVIDVQKAIDDPYWAVLGSRNNPDAERSMALVISAWRRAQLPLFHIRHDSRNPKSTYLPGHPGHRFKEEVMPLENEAIVSKNTNSAFIGTDLEARLRANNVRKIYVMGVITNNSVEATVRMAGNLGFDTYLMEDCCFTFPKKDHRGTLRTADDVHAMSLANMDGEYCTVINSRDVLEILEN